MTQEEKAKAYDKALEKARQLCAYPTSKPFISDLQDLFPELAESEDEKIRKEIISYIKNLTVCIGTDMLKKWIAWLEKQGEQKPDVSSLLSWSKVDEEMFHLLEGIVKDYWAKAEQEKNEIKIREASNVSYFLKTIQKSPLCWIKCSDGLPNRDGTYLVVTDGLYNEVYDMARYDSIEGWHKASEIIYWMPIPQLNDKSIIKQNPANYAKTCKDEQKDERVIKWVIDYIGNCPNESFDFYGGVGKEAVLSWLNKLKDILSSQNQKQWKPTEEQMKQLGWIAKQNKDNMIGKELMTLYNDLQKLREE